MSIDRHNRRYTFCACAAILLISMVVCYSLMPRDFALAAKVSHSRTPSFPVTLTPTAPSNSTNTPVSIVTDYLPTFTPAEPVITSSVIASHTPITPLTTSTFEAQTFIKDVTAPNPHKDFTASTNSCATCHRSHNGSGAGLLRDPGAINLCSECHADETYISGLDEALSTQFRKGELNLHSIHSIHSGCVQCHNPHSSQEPHQLQLDLRINTFAPDTIDFSSDASGNLTNETTFWQISPDGRYKTCYITCHNTDHRKFERSYPNYFDE